MLPIAKPLPIYDALLLLATPSERDAIANGGPRERLYHVLAFGTQAESDAATTAYEAIKAILSRIGTDPTLLITGIDSRLAPPKRDIVDAEVVLSGRLMWEDGGIQGKVQLEWMTPPIYIIALRVEPMQPVPDAPFVLKAPATPTSGKRREREPHIRRMQELMDTGLPPSKAAEQVEQEMPGTNLAPGSLKRWLLHELERQRAK